MHGIVPTLITWGDESHPATSRAAWFAIYDQPELALTTISPHHHPRRNSDYRGKSGRNPIACIQVSRKSTTKSSFCISRKPTFWQRDSSRERRTNRKRDTKFGFFHCDPKHQRIFPGDKRAGRDCFFFLPFPPLFARRLLFLRGIPTGERQDEVRFDWCNSMEQYKDQK